jgi:hypothetical protein
MADNVDWTRYKAPNSHESIAELDPFTLRRWPRDRRHETLGDRRATETPGRRRGGQRARREGA